MKRPFTFLALASLVLSMIGTASAADLYQLLPGVWNADNCDICKLNVINSGGYLYADMNDWGTWGYSYSGGYQPIEVVSDDTFFYRGDYFQFYYYGGSQFRVENISNGGDRNVAGANRYDYYPAPVPPRPIPRPVPPRPRPIPPRPRPIPPRPIPVPPRPVPPRPQPPRPQPPRPQPPRPQPPRPQPPRPQPPRPQPPRPQPPRPQPPRPQPPRPRPHVAEGADTE
jgi:hypothetical protein